MFIKVDQFFPKEQFRSTFIVPDSNFSKDCQNKKRKHEFLMETYIYIYIAKESLKRRHGSVYSFDQNVQKNIGKQLKSTR